MAKTRKPAYQETYEKGLDIEVLDSDLDLAIDAYEESLGELDTLVQEYASRRKHHSDAIKEIQERFDSANKPLKDKIEALAQETELLKDKVRLSMIPRIEKHGKSYDDFSIAEKREISYDEEDVVEYLVDRKMVQSLTVSKVEVKNLAKVLVDIPTVTFDISYILKRTPGRSK